MSGRFKLLILDYGGVYSFPYVAKNLNTIFKNAFGREPVEAERQALPELGRQLARNQITTQAYIQSVGDIMGIATLPSIQKFENATIAVTNPPTPEMVDMVNSLHQSGCRVALMSDMYMFEVNLTKPWGRYQGFDYVALSSEAGMTKDDPSFFLQTLGHLGVEANDALFVDDTQANIYAAQSIGMATILADKKDYPQVTDLINEIVKQMQPANR